MKLNRKRVQKYLKDFDFESLFIEELFWDNVDISIPPIIIDKDSYSLQAIAQKRGLIIYACLTPNEPLPPQNIRQRIDTEVNKYTHEHLIIYGCLKSGQQVWQWVKREGEKRPTLKETHFNIKQSGELLIQKLESIAISLEEEEAINLPEMTQRVKKGFDIEKVTKEFFGKFQEKHLQLVGFIEGIDNSKDASWYASVILNRLMFIYFLQKKGFLDDGNTDYLQDKLDESQQKGQDLYYQEFLTSLFFQGFGQREELRSDTVNQLIGKIKYLNGGLFLPHSIEVKYQDKIKIADLGFTEIFSLFSNYTWHLDDRQTGKDDEINPDVLGYIFEKYINQKEFGAYYTRPEITEYLCQRTIDKFIITKLSLFQEKSENKVSLNQEKSENKASFNQEKSENKASLNQEKSENKAPLFKGGWGDLNLDNNICNLLLDDILPNLSILDPACGSAAFLVAALKHLISIYTSIFDYIKQSGDEKNKTRLQEILTRHPSLEYYIKKRIITNNLYGIDIMEEATEIAKLRLFLSLVASAKTVDDLEPLPNIDFNIMAGNSLIGLIRVDGNAFNSIKKVGSPQKAASGKKTVSSKKNTQSLSVEEGKRVKENSQNSSTFNDKSSQNSSTFNDANNQNSSIFNHEPTQINLLEPTIIQGSLLSQLAASEYERILKEKNESIRKYKEHAFLQGEVKGTSQTDRLQMLRDHIEKVNRESMAKLNQLLLDEFSIKLGIKYEEVQLKGKGKKRLLTIADMETLKPFHWGYHFDEIIDRGGFDIIITNPPWETFQPNGKEFFAQYSENISKKKMSVKDFHKEIEKLLVDPTIEESWLKYQSDFVHIREYFRFAEQYKNQVPIINGKRHGKDVNLYKLFLEQCVNFLSKNGECGIVIPSGIYTDLGCKQLREMLFSQTKVTGLFCFENRKTIFEGVDSRFKFVILTFENSNQTVSFPAKFMRHEVAELSQFPDESSINIEVDLVKQLSPDSISVMEFKTDLDITITKKMSQFPLLGEQIEDTWNLELHREFNMTDDAYLFKTEPAKGRLPLYEGKMIHQFTHLLSEPRYWIDEQEGRKALLKKIEDIGQKLGYQKYRLAYRAIARNTDQRTLIFTVIPLCFTGNSLNISESLEHKDQLLCVSFLNSFIVDWFLRQKVSANINMFYIYQLPVPRLTEKDAYFKEIVERAAKLICTTPEYDELAQEVGLESHKKGVTSETERAKLRAELDGMIAHIYGLTETEFSHILSTFPIVAEKVKQDALIAYQHLI